ncbi:hypothetical protein F511_09494 [Dorcoceras hygrometricum]|uniref:Dystroglycan-like n=1 Tax=Dorcoceras hygrometricum TaxID=472368 RepID=A0A2Z7BQD7_9LAMI|nr:hypothetical protein F511_09494 [Dorcoceras hygrometricum]
MAASFFVNAMQVDFESVLAMEHTGMDKMFNSLEDTGVKGFLEASGSVYENETGTDEDVLVKAVGLPTEGMTRSLDIPSKTVAEMRMKFSGTDVPFRAPSKKMEYRLLHIISKSLYAKAGSFDVVTSEKFNLMVAITAGLKVNWAQVLFQVLVAMVNNPNRQSQGFAVQISVMLEQLVKLDLGEAVKLHPQNVLNNKSVHTYIKKNLNVVPTSESSKHTEDTVSGTEGGQSRLTKPVEK